MMSFDMLSPSLRALFALWALSLCLVGIVNTVFSAVKKRYLFSLLALVLFAPGYLAWQSIFDLALFTMGKTAALFGWTQTLCDLSWVWWFVVLIALTASETLLLGYNIIYERNHITPGAIKTYLDGIPCGVCCYKDNGRVLFSNVCMNRLCVALTDAPLLNGNHFYDAVSAGTLAADGKMWRFSRREIVLNGERLHELIASDVTTEYARTQALEKDKAELSRLNGELREYTLGIDETVRRQEILQAKVNIHDEMNRLMLSTVAAESKDEEALDRIFSLWEQNALLLCLQADETADKEALARIEKLAEALKIRLTWRESLPSRLTEKQRVLFFSAAQEAIANAAKHASAKEMVISFRETQEGIQCDFTNDGDVGQEEVRFAGGLANLVRLAKGQGATVRTKTGEGFTLTVVFPAENNPNG